MSKLTSDQATKQFFDLIHTDGRHAITFTLSYWRRGPRNIIFLEGNGRQAALAVGAPAETMDILLLVSIIAVPISTISIPIPTVGDIPVTILVTVAVPVAITVSVSVTITVAAVAAWWRRTSINSSHGRWRVLGPLYA
jgi:uncharacterized oligopeptide transporter (OPT) family protein